MHKSAPTHILIESSPFLFHVVLCGPHSGLGNGFTFIYFILAAVTAKELCFSIRRLHRFKNHAIFFPFLLFATSDQVFFFTFSFLAAIILHVSLLSPSLPPSVLALPPLMMPLSDPVPGEACGEEKRSCKIQTLRCRLLQSRL